MSFLKQKPLTSFLLALILILSLFTVPSFAADIEIPDLSNEEAPLQVEISPEKDFPQSEQETPLNITDETSPDNMPADVDLYSGQIPNSEICWQFDSSSAQLKISGTGGCPAFASEDDQPWAAFRTEIREVWFDSMASLSIADLAYWFSGCTALIRAEIPYTTHIIGTDAFAGCSALTDILFYYRDTDEVQIAPGAFSVALPIDTTLWVISQQQRAVIQIALYDWDQDNRHVQLRDVYETSLLAGCAIGTCKCADCTSYTGYKPLDEDYHDKFAYCTNCSASFWLSYGAHSFSGNRCTLCGYTKQTCSHTSTATRWSGCNWTEYCRSCGKTLDSGITHGTYVYGSWEYADASRHRRHYACSDCGEGAYSYESHSTTSKYTNYNDTQHSVRRYCSTCSSYIGTTSYENHAFSYGAWTNDSATQHKRQQTCSSCGHSTYAYAAHTFVYGSWSPYSDTQHSRTVRCGDCSYSMEEYGVHTDTDKDGLCDSCSYAMITHITVTFDAGNGILTENAKTVVYGDSFGTLPIPTLDGYAFDGWFTARDGGIQISEESIVTVKEDFTLYAHWTQIKVFSVTVPANLSLTVSKHGEVYAASNAAIINRSTSAVMVTELTVSTENGWTLVPYSYNMANEKVDAKKIGFKLNNAATARYGSTENLELSDNWTIARNGSLQLSYDAVVSATSEPVDEQVLMLVFVMCWDDNMPSNI